MSFFLSQVQEQQIISKIEQLLQQLGYQYVGQTEVIYKNCNTNQGQCSINFDQIILEKPEGGSYFLIIPIQWSMSINAPPDSGLCYNYSSTREIKVYGIRQISSNVQKKDLLIDINASGYLDQYSDNCQNYDNTLLAVGDSYYMPYYKNMLMLVHSQYDKIELQISIQQNAVYNANCSSPYNAQCYLEIGPIRVYYVDMFTFLNNLSLILTLLSFLLGVLE